MHINLLKLNYLGFLFVCDSDSFVVSESFLLLTQVNLFIPSAERSLRAAMAAISLLPDKLIDRPQS